MRTAWLRVLACGLVLALAAPFLSACTVEDGFDAGGAPMLSQPEHVRTPPPLRLAEFEGANAMAADVMAAGGPASAQLDLTNVNKGYVAATCTAPYGVQFMMIKGSDDIHAEDRIQLPMENDGTVNIFNFTQGSGDYFIVIFVNNSADGTGTNYTRAIETWVSVQLEDEFAPYLINTREVDYGASSKAVLFSYDLARHCATDLEVAQQIYEWIQENVKYDTAKSERVRVVKGYIPDPDDTLATKTGICYDYASLAATMLRANGIPCKLVKGDALVNPETGEWVYHAWNLIYLEEAGWIAVQMPTAPGEYFRIDLTFAAGLGGGRNAAEHVQNDDNYVTTEIT